MMQALAAEAKAEGLPEKRTCRVLRISPRSLQRWRRPPQPKAPGTPRPRPVNALTRAEAATVVSLIRSAEHADQSCRGTGPEPGRQPRYGLFRVARDGSGATRWPWTAPDRAGGR